DLFGPIHIGRQAWQHRSAGPAPQGKGHGKAIRPTAAECFRAKPMTPFELAEPTSLAAAVRLLDQDDPTIRPAGGCTALMLMMNAVVLRPEQLTRLRKIESRYSEIPASAEDLRIGAMTTLRQLEKSNEVRMYAPLVTQTLPTLSNVRVRNVATIGGAPAHGAS